MNDGQIRALIAVCDLGSMTKAAGQLYLSVPAIKKQIDSLERELAVTLFSRTSRGVKLTKAGEEFLAFSRRMMADVEDELRKVRTMHNQDSEQIRIGFDNHLVRDCVFHYVVFDFKHERRNFAFTTELCDGFDPVRYDIFFGANHSDRGDVRAHYLCDLPLTCLVPKGSSWANHRSIALTDINPDEWVLPPKEMLAFAQPSIFDDLKDINDKFMRLHDSNRAYSDKSLFEGKICIVIGFDEHVNTNLIQIPLDGYRFRYHMYTSTLNKKAVVQALVDFMQQHYPLKLNELMHKVM